MLRKFSSSGQMTQNDYIFMFYLVDFFIIRCLGIFSFFDIFYQFFQEAVIIRFGQNRLHEEPKVTKRWKDKGWVNLGT